MEYETGKNQITSERLNSVITTTAHNRQWKRIGFNLTKLGTLLLMNNFPIFWWVVIFLTDCWNMKKNLVAEEEVF